MWKLLTRDLVMFSLGAAGFIHEVVLNSGVAERPYTLTACLALMGLPGVLRWDEMRRKDK